MSLLSDDIRAVKDLWLIGDTFLKQMYHTLRAVKMGQTAPGLSREQQQKISEHELYIHRMFNVKTYYTKVIPGVNNPLMRVVNALINAMNEPTNLQLPRMIIIMLDDEFLHMMNFKDFGISMMIGKCLEWLVREIHDIVHDQRHLLKYKRLGAVSRYEPKIIWSHMMINDRLNAADINLLHQKFNAILNQVICQEGEGFTIVPITSKTFPSMFDCDGALHHEGRVSFWKLFSQMVDNFDNQANTSVESQFQVLDHTSARSAEDHGSFKRCLYFD